MSDVAIETEGLCRDYGRFRALDHATLAIERHHVRGDAFRLYRAFGQQHELWFGRRTQAVWTRCVRRHDPASPGEQQNIRQQQSEHYAS